MCRLVGLTVFTGVSELVVLEDQNTGRRGYIHLCAAESYIFSFPLPLHFSDVHQQSPIGKVDPPTAPPSSEAAHAPLGMPVWRGWGGR